jgi:hypothetical protein
MKILMRKLVVREIPSLHATADSVPVLPQPIPLAPDDRAPVGQPRQQRSP